MLKRQIEQLQPDVILGDWNENVGKCGERKSLHLFVLSKGLIYLRIVSLLVPSLIWTWFIREFH